MATLALLPLPEFGNLDTLTIRAALLRAHRDLAELKGLSSAVLHQGVLLETLVIQEAKDNSGVESIVATHEEFFAAPLDPSAGIAPKEVQHYLEGLRTGFAAVRESSKVPLETILSVHAKVEPGSPGLRETAGTVLRSKTTGETFYEPPQDAAEVSRLLENLVSFIHQDDELDPLLRLAIVHHQFASIHPFYDGNGRTGRILNTLVLIREGLLELPILHLSRYINRTKPDYYHLLQLVRKESRWEDWCLYMLRGISHAAQCEMALIRSLRDLMEDYRKRIQDTLPKVYSEALIDNLFRYPYTKIELLERELGVSRPTATKYLALLTERDFLEKQKIGRSNYFINRPLFVLLTSVKLPAS